MHGFNYDMFDDDESTIDRQITADEYETLRYSVLKYSLSQLADKRCSQVIRDEVRSWFMDDRMYDELTGEVLPFSFATLCAEQGINHFDFREVLLQFLDRNNFESFEDSRQSLRVHLAKLIRRDEQSKVNDMFGFDEFAA